MVSELLSAATWRAQRLGSGQGVIEELGRKSIGAIGARPIREPICRQRLRLLRFLRRRSLLGVTGGRDLGLLRRMPTHNSTLHDIDGRIGPRLDDESVLQRRSNSGDEIFRVSDTGVTTREGSDADNARDGVPRFESFDIDELTKLKLIGEDEIVILIREGDIGSMRGIGDLDEESMVRPELTSGKGRDDTDDLKEDGSVFTKDTNIRIDVLEEFEEDTRVRGSHGGGRAEEEIQRGDIAREFRG